MSDAIEISFVVPVFDEAPNVAPLARELDRLAGRLACACEVVFVDDASTDGTAHELAGIVLRHAAWRPRRHVRRAGQSAAVATGFAHARGRTVVTLDGDGQNDPADVPLLLEALAHADVACGVRVRRADSWLRRVSSRVGNAFRDRVTGHHVTDTGCGLRALRRAALAEVPVFDGMHRFLPTLLHAQGFRVAEVAVGHRPRTRGRSKYGVRNRMARGLLDCFGVRWYCRRAVPAARCRPVERTSDRRAPSEVVP